MRRWQAIDTLPDGVRAEDVAVAEELHHAVDIGGLDAVLHGKQRARFRREGQLAAMQGVMQRLHAEVVAREQKAPTAVVPQAEGEDAAQAQHDVVAPLFVAVHDHFGIGVRCERMTGFHELGAQLGEVVDLAVECQQNAAVLIGQGLTACLAEIDDRQAAVRQVDLAPRRGPFAETVRAAMAQSQRGLLQALVVAPTRHAEDPAHQRNPTRRARRARPLRRRSPPGTKLRAG